MKICKKCLIEKNLIEFNKDKTKSDGLYSSCKVCRNKVTTVYYENNKEQIGQKTREYYQLNKEKCRKSRRIYQNRKCKEDINFKLVRRLRSRLYYALKAKSWKKTTKFSQYIGCSLDELKKYLQSKFQPGMTWENYGKWHIDHIIPLSSVDTQEKLYVLCHYANLQPLWASDNLSKYNKII